MLSSRHKPATHKRGSHKIPSRYISAAPALAVGRKPPWLRIKLRDNPRIQHIRELLRNKNIHTVCEEAKCPNLPECFSQSTATFMILGDICTRRCAFCDVAHGRPSPPDPGEPERLAHLIAELELDYVVITSVDRDDLEDRGAGHFASCISAIRLKVENIKIEILVPDFRARVDQALTTLSNAPCDVFNHNIETVPRLYRNVRRGADYHGSLHLLLAHKKRFPDIPTKSGLMLGLGEDLSEVEAVMGDLIFHKVDYITLGQYLQPGDGYMPVQRYLSPDEFKKLAALGYAMGFAKVQSGPLVRSSYHASKEYTVR
ncbi:MAG: lipoyl synthase [Chromatiales bacterium]|nr:lipoyl synthase [Chromatiales bacterium]